MTFNDIIWDYLVWDDTLEWEDRLFGCMTLDVKYDWESIDYLTFNNLNRIEGNINCVRMTLEMFDNNILGVDKEDWEIKSIFFYQEINRIEQNIKNMIDRLTMSNTCKINWSIEALNYSEINRIEQNTLDLFNHICSIIKSFKKCGYTTCGQSFKL